MVTLLKLGSSKKYRYQQSSLFLQIRWLYNDEPVSGKDFLPSVSGSRQVLAIPAVLKSHGGGKITCSAENEVGKASCSAFLRVTGNILELVPFYSTHVINQKLSIIFFILAPLPLSHQASSYWPATLLSFQ